MTPLKLYQPKKREGHPKSLTLNISLTHHLSSMAEDTLIPLNFVAWTLYLTVLSGQSPNQKEVH